MPTYHYRCPECFAFLPEFRLSEARDNPKRCGCGGEAKRITAFGEQIVLVPAHFQKHTHTTGLPPMDLRRRKWNRPGGL